MSNTQAAVNYITSCCSGIGSCQFTGEELEFLVRTASDMAAAGPSRVFPDRYYEHVAYALDVVARERFTSPPAAIASVYLATRFEFYFRILSGQLDGRGRWLGGGDGSNARAHIQARYPARTDLQVNKKRVSSVSVAYKVMKQNTARPIVSVFESLDRALYSTPITMPNGSVVEDVGDRISFMRNAGGHGEWGDISAEAIFFGLVTAIVFYGQT